MSTAENQSHAHERKDPSEYGFLHSMESGAAVDGPGMRFVFFMSGCQFKCLYCHNPDTWKLHNGTYLDIDSVLKEIKGYARFPQICRRGNLLGRRADDAGAFRGGSRHAPSKRNLTCISPWIHRAFCMAM